MPSERSPELSEVIRRGARGELIEVHTAIPAKVVKWDAATQRADCKPLVQRAYLDETGARVVESLPVVPGVPVQFLGSGPYRETYPISDGNLQLDGATVAATTGTLVFFECSADKWLTGDGAEVDPEIDHSHALTDAVFVPGLRPFGAALKSVPSDHATIGHDQGVQVHLHKGVVTVADDETMGTDFVALAQKVSDQLTALKNAINGWTPVPNDGGAALKTALATLFTTWPESVAASQFKTK